MRYLARIAIALILYAHSTLFAQTTSAPPTPPSPAFDVVSIKPSAPNSRGFSGLLSDAGYISQNAPMSATVFSAYFQNFKGNKIIGLPAWARDERYDIVAHIDEATAPSWLKLSYVQRWEPARPMLQKLLADRCKLVAHLVPAQVDGYALVVSKRGSRLTPTKPGGIYPPEARKFGSDGAMYIPASPSNDNTISFFNAPVELLVERISTNWVIQDQTNLTGRYDFTIHPLQIPRDADGKATITNPVPSDQWDISDTGLELKPAKLPSQNLVIDHIERPSPN